MALSEYEKQVLAEMEQHLRQQDPDLADAMAKAAPVARASAEPSSKLSPRRIALGGILAAAGLAIVITGVSISFSVVSVILGVVGFVMMVGGVLYALSTGEKKNKGMQPQSGIGDQEPPKDTSNKIRREQQREERWKNRG